jgi:hypothetical protein
MCYDAPVVVKYCVFFFASWCESQYDMLSQEWGIMVNYAAPVVVKHDMLCAASGCEPWRLLLSQWFVNHGELCCGSVLES